MIEIDHCRICDNQNLVSVLDLGDQYLSGVFPRARDHLCTLTHGPLELIKCHGDKVCGLLQLRQSYPLSEMYGDNYGYRSELNRTMVDHLQAKARKIMSLVPLDAGDVVVDIGSNDGTLLHAYPYVDVILVGFDPAGEKFRQYYRSHVQLIPEFFSAAAYRDRFGNQKAKIVTSIAMFYDVETPMQFMREVCEILADDGVWVTEQSYMPEMLRNGAYDTICHEHLEYYGLQQIRWMAERSGLRILDVEYNDINGGSFCVILARDECPYGSEGLSEDPIEGCATLSPYVAFAERVARSRDHLQEFFIKALREGKNVLGLGASTKGNTILQYCAITASDLASIGDVNADKHGCFTPGSRIPIMPEEQVLGMCPDYLLVLPWHFRNFFLDKPGYADFSLVFPLPSLEVVRPG